jgi:protease-4
LKSFFKYFFSALLALVVFFGLIFIIMVGVFGSLLNKSAVTIPSQSVLVVDLSRPFQEKKIENPLIELTGNTEDDLPSLHQLVRMIEAAKSDSLIKGIYVVATGNANGFAASEEIRNAFLDFKSTGKFIIAYGDYIDQEAYHVANVADKVYCNPKGSLDWRGFSVQYMYFKKALEKLEIQPQIFYDGKFKSATEPFREEKMTAANRLQTETWLGDIYGHFLVKTAEARKSDTASLHAMANEYALRDADDAVQKGLLDGVRYDDEIKSEIKKRLNLKDDDKISFITPGTYLESGILNKGYKKEKIAVVYAEGEIVYGRGDEGQIGSDEYKALLRRLRYNKDVKAVVLRINSPGGSSLASEIIWREIEMLKKAGKPVVVSMGDVAASGGYYIACNADSIFAEPNTITGSIGVFAIVPDFSGFMKNKLGITFDGVKTATYADALTVTRPLNQNEKKIIQHEVDDIYADFKQRVADGRKKDTAYVDSIAQGRVWTGTRAKQIGLVDRLGHIKDAVDCAAKLANLKEYNLREYPEPQSPLEMFFGGMGKQYQAKLIQKEIGAEQYKLYMNMKKLREQSGHPMARMPFDLSFE